MNGKISIIIPVYNRGKVIEECIKSILDQSHKNFEIILIDDGSDDNTLDVCKNLSQNEPRIKLLVSQHCGVSAARNMGLDAADGEYVFFLDSDDIIHPLLLETLCDSLKNSDASMAGTLVMTVSEKNWDIAKKRIIENFSVGETSYHKNIDAINAVFRTQTPFSVIGGVMMRRDLIGDTRFDTSLYIGEDFYFIYENLIKGANTVYLKQKWYLARWHTDNISKNYDFSAFWTRFYRRVLVWRSELALGRTENANCQKIDGMGTFLRCYRNNRKNKSQINKMRKTLKKFRKEITSTLPFSGVFRYYIYVYFTSLHLFLTKLKKKFKK